MPRSTKHQCPVCLHVVELTSQGSFKSHSVDGQLRFHAPRKNLLPYCRGSAMRVSHGVVYDADNRPVKEVEV